jgi:hypothetical protein
VLPLELQTFVMMMSQVKGVRRKEVLIDRREKIRRRSSVLIQMGAAFHFYCRAGTSRHEYDGQYLTSGGAPRQGFAVMVVVGRVLQSLPFPTLACDLSKSLHRCPAVGDPHSSPQALVSLVFQLAAAVTYIF